MTTDSDGKAGFSNIGPGYYEIRETVPPAGYVTEGNDCFYIKIDQGVVYILTKEAGRDPKNWTATSTDTTVANVTFTAATAEPAAPATAQVANTPGTALPMTGGIGTNLFTILGAILSGTAGAILTIRRRKHKQTA